MDAAFSGLSFIQQRQRRQDLVCVCDLIFGIDSRRCRARGAADFCRPTYPSEASFCISPDVSSGPGKNPGR